MGYLGTPIDTTNQFQSLSSKQFNGDGSTTDFTLDIAPGSVNDIEVFVGNVRQDPHSAYTLSGTTLTFTGAPPSGTNNIYVVHQAKAVSTITPATGTVTNDMLAGSIANSKLANSSISINGSSVSLGGSLTGIGGDMSPSFFAYRNGTQSMGDNTWTKIQINTEVYDEGSNYDHSTNYRFTPTTAGKFFVYGQSLVYANGQTDINYSQLKVYKNGSEHLLGENDFRGSRPYGIQSNVQGVVDMNGSSDYLELYVRQSTNSANTNYIQGNSTKPTHFGAFKIIT